MPRFFSGGSRARYRGAPAIARIGAITGEGNGFQFAKFFRRRLDEQANLPMPRVIAERDGFAIRRAQAALRAQDQKLFTPKFGWIPAHARVLRQAEQISARTLRKHFFGERQASRRAGAAGFNAVNFRRVRSEDIVARIHRHNLITDGNREHG